MSLPEPREETKQIEIVARSLTADEARVLHEELKTTANILGYTVREITGFREALVAEVEGQFAGACVSKDLLFNWTDIAVLYVLPAFRGRGLGTRLYTAAWERGRARNRHLFTLSRSPEVIHLMEALGMTMTRSLWKAPLAVHLHMNRHMMSLYRNQEMIRKAKQRKVGGGSATPFVSGTKRSGSGGGA